MGRTEPQRISRVGQTELARLMESQIWHQPAGSVALLGEGSERGYWPEPTFLSGRKFSPSSCFDARHFSSSMYATGAFQAASPVLKLRGRVSLNKSMCGFLKRNCLELQKFLPLTPLPLVFAARSYGDLSSWHWIPGLGAWCGAGTPGS